MLFSWIQQPAWESRTSLLITCGASDSFGWGRVPRLEREDADRAARLLQAGHGTFLEVRAIKLQCHLTKMGCEGAAGIAVDDQGECRPLVEQVGEHIEGEAQQVGRLAGIR